ncbi:MAG: S8 family peptidase [Candidatus Solibacter sp.]
MNLRLWKYPIFLVAALPLVAQRHDTYQGRDAVANQVLVRLTSKTTASLQQIRNLTDADDLRELSSSLQLHLLHSRTGSIAALLAILRALPTVNYVEPDYFVKSFGVPNDANFPNQWALRNTSVPGADIGATAAWDVSTGSTANVVAVVDTGVDYTHPDLAPNMWSAPAAFTVTLSWGQITCPAGSHGYNAITRSCDPMDDNHHGTHVSGSIGAAGNNTLGVAGVNWTTRIMGLKFLDSTGSGSTSNAIDAIEFAIQAKAVLGASANVRVLSNSYGGDGFSQAFLDEINKANTKEMLFVVAAGNSAANTDVNAQYPAAFNAPNLISVAATTSTDTLASFSNFGSHTISMGAPGVNILSTVPGSAYAYLSGTSMATPHVAGAAMLVLSKCALNTAALKSTLLSQVDALASLAGLTVTGGRLNVNKALRSCAPGLGPGGAATFIRSDATTLGSWKGVYGSEGSVVVGNTSTVPAYATVTPSGNLSYTWAASTSDTRALQKTTSTTDRVAACWYSNTFSIDLNFTDSNSHQVAFYLLDWESGGRAVRVDVLDGTTLGTLDTRSVSSFAGGQYLVWTLSGHVVIRLTSTNPANNSVVSGIFFGRGGAPTTGGAAAFIRSDATTLGSWKGVYGSEGSVVMGNTSTVPSYATVTPSGSLSYTWAASSSDVRALQKTTSATDRVAACWYSNTFSIDLNFTDSNSHQVAFYLLDWESGGRAVRVDVLDGTTLGTLDTRSVSSFAGGQYLVWTLSGHVVVRLTSTNPANNSVVSGIFFGTGAALAPGGAATFIRSDATTLGSWKGVYGSEGSVVVGNTSTVPAYATVTPSGNLSYTWAASTSDTRALQKTTSTTDRVAACWYSNTFSIDLNFTDSNSHQVAFYLLDWESGGRAVRVDVLDGTTLGTLDTRSVSNFAGGQYLVWTLSGHVVVRLTSTNPANNSVVSGLFFGTGGAVAPGAAATFLRLDTATQGTWKGSYGTDGGEVIGNTASYPAYATVTHSGSSQYVWAPTITDPRALQKFASTTDRIAGCWFGPNFSVDVQMNDSNAHQVALYLLDWDTFNGGRAERVDILDATTNAVLDTRSVSAFTAGQYLVWNIAGHVIIRIMNTTTTANAVMSAIFFR